jgi:hypothetical protein
MRRSDQGDLPKLRFKQSIKSASMVGYITIAVRYASLVASVFLSRSSNRSHNWMFWFFAMVTKIIYVTLLPYIVVWKVFVGMVDLALSPVKIGNQPGDKDRSRQHGLDDADSQSSNRRLSCETITNGQRSVSRTPTPKAPQIQIEKLNNKSNTKPNSKSATVAEQYHESLVPQPHLNRESRFGSVNMFDALGDMEVDMDTLRSTAARKLLDGSITMVSRLGESELSPNSTVTTRGSSRRSAKRHRKAIAALFHQPASETAALQPIPVPDLSDPFLSHSIEGSSQSNRRQKSSRPKQLSRLPRSSRVTNSPSPVKHQCSSASTGSRRKQVEFMSTTENLTDYRSQINHDKPIIPGANGMPPSRKKSVSDGLITSTIQQLFDNPMRLAAADLSTPLRNTEVLQVRNGNLPDGGRPPVVLTSMAKPILLGETGFGQPNIEHE